MADGDEYTVIVVAVLQPLPNEYVIELVPFETLVTTPDASTVATPGVLLLHVPPLVVLLNDTVVPTHIVVVPLIADGAADTVTTVVLVQLPAAVNVIVAVPDVIPATTPPDTVATLVLLLLHVPLPADELSVVVEPAHTVPVPLSVDELPLTVMLFTA